METELKCIEDIVLLILFKIGSHGILQEIHLRASAFFCSLAEKNYSVISTFSSTIMITKRESNPISFLSLPAFSSSLFLAASALCWRIRAKRSA